MLPKDRFAALIASGGRAVIEIQHSGSMISIGDKDGHVTVDFDDGRSFSEPDLAMTLGKLNFALAAGDLGRMGGFDDFGFYDAGTVVRMKLSDGSAVVSTILETDGSPISRANALVQVEEGRRVRLIEFGISGDGLMLEKGEVPFDKLSPEWLARLAWSETWVKGRRTHPRDLFVARYGEAALAKAGAAIDAEENQAMGALAAAARGEPDPSEMEAAAVGKEVAAWLAIADEIAAEPKWKAPRTRRLNPLAEQRAIEAAPTNAIWAGCGEIDNLPWRAALYRGEFYGRPVVRIELDRAGKAEWSMFSLRVHRPDVEDWALRRQTGAHSYPGRLEIARGEVTLGLEERHVVYATVGDQPDEEVHSRGGPELRSREVLKAVAERILADQTSFLVKRLLTVHRANTAATVRNLVEAAKALKEAEEDVEKLRLELDRLIATLPERDRRRLADLPASEMTADPEYLRETALGVLRIRPRPDGSGIEIEPTGRHCKMVIQGRLRDNERYYTSVDRDGTITEADFYGCSRVVGERLLLEAVRSFIAARPEAFTRARMAEIARQTSGKAAVLDQARAAYDERAEAFERQGEEHAAVLSFAENRPEAAGIGWPPYPKFEAPEEADEAEETPASGPTPLW